MISIITNLLLLVSCSNDSPTNQNNNNINTTTSDFFPLKIGSWWKYKESFDPISNIYSIDSTTITRTLPVFGKEAYEFVSYFINPDTYEIENIDTNYFYKEGPNIYRIIFNSFTQKDEWNLYVNLQLEYIKIFEYPYSTPWNEGEFEGIARLERIVEGPEKFYLGEKTINAIKTKYAYSLVGNYKVGDKTEPMNEVIISSNEWFGYQVGIVKDIWQNDEFEKILIDYYIPE